MKLNHDLIGFKNESLLVPPSLRAAQVGRRFQLVLVYRMCNHALQVGVKTVQEAVKGQRIKCINLSHNHSLSSHLHKPCVHQWVHPDSLI